MALRGDAEGARRKRPKARREGAPEQPMDSDRKLKSRRKRSPGRAMEGRVRDPPSLELNDLATQDEAQWGRRGHGHEMPWNRGMSMAAMKWPFTPKNHSRVVQTFAFSRTFLRKGLDFGF